MKYRDIRVCKPLLYTCVGMRECGDLWCWWWSSSVTTHRCTPSNTTRTAARPSIAWTVQVLVSVNLANDVTDYALTTLETGWFQLLVLPWRRDVAKSRTLSHTSSVEATAAAAATVDVATRATLPWYIGTTVQLGVGDVLFFAWVHRKFRTNRSC